MKGVVSSIMVVLLLAGVASAATYYWDGTSGSWSAASGWSTSASAATPDPAAAPGSGDVAVFSIDTLFSAQNVSLGADQAASKLEVLGTATGGTAITGGGTDRTLNLGSGGIAIEADAGPVAIGSRVPGQGVQIALTAAQTWTNGCSNPLTVENTISGSGLLTLQGSGGFRLNGSNTLSGGITTKGPAPVVYFGNDNALGTNTFTSGGGMFAVEDFPVVLSNKVKINNATSRWSGDARLTLAGSGESPAVAITLSHNGGTFDVPAGTLELSGTVSGSYGALNKTGAGTLLLSGANSYSGPTTVSEGALTLGSDLALGTASTNSNRAISPVYVQDGATLDIAGRSAWIGNFTLVDGTVADSVGGGVLGAYSFTVENGTIAAALADVKVPNAGNLSDSVNLFKRTTGMVTLTGANTYGGTTFVKEGALRVNGSLASAVIVEADGTLCGTGSLNRTVNVEGGVLAPGVDGAGSGSITLGRFLRIADGGSLKIGVGAAASGRVVMTHPEARVLLQNAQLDLSLLPGGVPTLAAGVTVIDNQGSEPVEGAFADLPEGGVFEIGNGRFVAITYAGGDGNDVVALLQNRSTVLVLR